MTFGSITRSLALLACAGLALGLSACGDEESVDPAAPAPTTEAPADPAIDVSPETREFTAQDATGADVTFAYDLETPALRGVSASTSAAFDEAYERIVADSRDRLAEAIAALDASDLSCQVSEGCEIPVTISASVAELQRGYATVTTHEDVTLGTTASDQSASSFTLDLEQGEIVELGDLLDLDDPSVLAEIENAASRAEGGCEVVGDAGELVESVAWSPTDDGILLTWDAQSAPLPRACSFATATVPWPGA